MAWSEILSAVLPSFITRSSTYIPCVLYNRQLTSCLPDQLFLYWRSPATWSLTFSPIPLIPHSVKTIPCMHWTALSNSTSVVDITMVFILFDMVAVGVSCRYKLHPFTDLLVFFFYINVISNSKSEVLFHVTVSVGLNVQPCLDIFAQYSITCTIGWKCFCVAHAIHVDSFFTEFRIFG